MVQQKIIHRILTSNVVYQMVKWVQYALWRVGFSFHNRLFDECTPDLSCCGEGGVWKPWKYRWSGEFWIVTHPSGVELCYSWRFQYIGDLNFTQELYKKGIDPRYRPGQREACSIGYCKKEKAWYAWSHRGGCRFAVGDVLCEGHIVSPRFFEGHRLRDEQQCYDAACYYAESVG